MDEHEQCSQALPGDSAFLTSQTGELEHEAVEESILSTDYLTKAFDVLEASCISDENACEEFIYKHAGSSSNGGSSLESSVQQHSMHDNTEDNVCTSPLPPLLSPFVSMKHEQLAGIYDVQTALNFPTPSPSVPQTSDPANDVPSSSMGTLLSPFRGQGRRTPFPKNVSPSKTPQPSSPWASISAVGSTEVDSPTIELNSEISFESLYNETSNLPSTSTVTIDASENTSDFDVPSEMNDGKFVFPSKEQAICSGSDDVIVDYIHDLLEGNKSDPVHSSFGSPLADISPVPGSAKGDMDSNSASIVHSRSTSPVACVKNEQVAIAATSNQVSTPRTIFQGSTQSNDSLKKPEKRPLEADGSSQPPVPKRITLASQKQQHRKLASPFRSPLHSKANPGNVITPDRTRAASNKPSPLSSAPRQNGNEDLPSTPSRVSDRPFPATLACTRPSKSASVVHSRLVSSSKATSKFKSPLMSSSIPSTPSRMNTSRTIQEMERKVQLLKRAIKIKKDGDGEKLEQLVKKWKEVGREAALDLWQIVRDNDDSSDAPYPGTNSKSAGGSFSSSWGWADASSSGANQGRNGLDSDGRHSWGWDAPVTKSEHEDDIDDDFEPESPSKLESKLYKSLRKKPAVSRTSMLPPTPRGAYYEQWQMEAGEGGCTYGDGGPDEDKEGEDVEGQNTNASITKSLGTMLNQIGIAHETLGWVEDEGDFVDD